MEFPIMKKHGDFLEHFGILGMKWGKRNGPPYPLSYEKHSSAEKKQNSKAAIDGKPGNSKTSTGGSTSKASKQKANAPKASENASSFKDDQYGDSSTSMNIGDQKDVLVTVTHNDETNKATNIKEAVNFAKKYSSKDNMNYARDALAKEFFDSQWAKEVFAKMDPGLTRDGFIKGLELTNLNVHPELGLFEATWFSNNLAHWLDYESDMKTMKANLFSMNG